MLKPTDPDHDRQFEDLNGNGWKDYNDVIVMYENLDWVTANEPFILFDYDHNLEIEYNDVITLFIEIGSG